MITFMPEIVNAAIAGSDAFDGVEGCAVKSVARFNGSDVYTPIASASGKLLVINVESGAVVTAEAPTTDTNSSSTESSKNVWPSTSKNDR